ncbi:uncharacterized protein FIESC28_05778 [Fusarium coffeatum]|uniref:Uncharacterized protein n=1 Tax=Fusarium coffeatum TaxID=231269 RepID=A0A366RR97_9HYPO|nr:uncharacterized protein FIESC28_05778 [Fusarium coffeatum]RBR18956.1 hypothetical protein FIESC28_05778 [Fusarium coffeatum]
MDEWDKFKNIACQPYSPYMLVLLQAAVQVIQKRYERYPHTLILSNPMQFPSQQEVDRSMDMEPRDVLMPPVDAPWFEYADRVSRSATFGGDKVTPALRNLVRGESLDEKVVRDYLHLLKTASSSTKISSIRALDPHGEIHIESEGFDMPTVIPMSDGQEWAFAVAYHDCIHWYDSRPDGRRPCFAISGGRKVMENWRGPQASESENSSIFMLMGVSRIMQQKPHVSQKTADEHGHAFRKRMLVELLAGQLEPTPEYLAEKGIIKGVRVEGESIFVSQTDCLSPFLPQEENSFDDAIDMTMWEDTAGRVRSTSLTRPTSAVEGEVVCECVGHEAANGGLQSASAFSFRPILPSGPLLQPTAFGGMSGSLTILENLTTGLRFLRTATASGFDDEYTLWLLGQSRKTNGKLQQRYQRVLFNEKMEERNSQNFEISRFPDGQWDKMMKDSKQWKMWKDLRDIGRKHDDLGEFVTLCALPGSMNKEIMPLRYQEKLVDAFEKEIENNSSPLRQWLRDARELCESIFKKSIPAYLVKLDDYEASSEEEVTDTVWRSLLSTDPAQDHTAVVEYAYHGYDWTVEEL